MPESASAVSQIAEEEHSWGKQMKRESKKENVRETTEKGEKRKKKMRECSKVQSVSRWLMSEVRGKQFLASGFRRVANHVAKAEASLNMECDRSLKYGGTRAQKSLGSWISAEASYC